MSSARRMKWTLIRELSRTSEDPSRFVKEQSDEQERRSVAHAKSLRLALKLNEKLHILSEGRFIESG